MTHDEVLEACRDWLKKVHGIIPNSDAKVYYRSNYAQASGEAAAIAVEYDSVERPEETPYRG